MTLSCSSLSGSGFSTPQRNLLVLTDLDGTLLDHDSYSYEPALPALQQLNALQIPVIFVTSKTCAEVEELRRHLQNPYPFIVENGSALVMPKNYFPHDDQTESHKGFDIVRFCPTYAALRQQLQQWRDLYHFDFTGFGDWSDAEVAQQTGLSLVEAGRAKQRLGSEPFLWNDTDTALVKFSQLISDAGLRLVRGGRFYHVLGKTDKARAIQVLLGLYQKHFDFSPQTIALGDSPNDQEMLAAADQAVMIKNHQGQHSVQPGSNPTYYTRAKGPSGWCEAIQSLLESLKE